MGPLRFRKGELKVTFTRPLQLKDHLYERRPLTLSLRHLFQDKNVRYVKKEHIIGIIPVKDFFKNMN